MTRNALTEPIITIRRGLAIYKIGASPYWQCRVRIPGNRRYKTCSTKETTRLEARRVADEIYDTVRQQNAVAMVPKEFAFETFAHKLIKKQYELAKIGVVSLRLAKGDEGIILNKTTGLLKFFGGRDIRQVRSRDVNVYLQSVKETRVEPFAFTTYSNRISCLRKVFKIARDEAVIDTIPDTPRPFKKQDNPRPFFRFFPLVSKEHDEYARILKTAGDMARQNVRVRWIPVTQELCDIILFLMNTFLRPTVSELYSLRYRDVTIATNPSRLVLTIRKGKTGYRQTDTLQHAVAVYRRCQRRYPNWKPDDYVFLPKYANRETARNIIGRQFREVLKRVHLEQVDSKTPPSLYSIRHTAICMRLVKSKGKVNIFNLAKSAGTSVEQLERFYVKYLPPSPEMARNLQTFGED